jgi:hypothetical protein
MCARDVAAQGGRYRRIDGIFDWLRLVNADTTRFTTA